MSEKQSVPTFQITLRETGERLEGPVVSPDRRTAVVSLSQFHEILQSDGAVLIYSGRWVYLPGASIRLVEKGKSRFLLPWPLVTEQEDQ